jgi:hypothetical protein
MKNNKVCPNCENSFKSSFEFCPHCGQKNKEIKLGFKYLLSDLLSGSLNIDSKFFKTFRYLIFRPAFLSQEFVKGKRTSYLTPIRIYLLVSVVYFFVLSLTSTSPVSFSESKNNTETQENLTSADSLKMEKGTALDFETGSIEGNSLLGIGKEKFKFLESKEGRQVFSKKFMNNISVLMFFVMPIAALFLLMFFGKNTFYFQHLVFLIHLQSVAFIIMSIFDTMYYFFPIDKISTVGKILVLFVVIVWIKKFYRYKWFKSFFASLLFLMSYFLILGISFIVLAYVSLLIL